MCIKLSKNFSLDEFTRSGTARRLGLDNTPDARTLLHLEALADVCLQPIRDHFGPVTILSGYRSAAVNTAVGSSERSAHLYGMGVDFTVAGHSTRELVEWIRDNLPSFDQAIDEFGDWVHLGRRQPISLEARGQILEAYKVGTRTHYRFIPRPD
ncbi:MAG: zinc D-Ala-D-Ala carboxypeptidase [Motiliproteus sp.]|jgi:zinc D-Ala-D-Ala carboxypeptidase